MDELIPKGKPARTVSRAAECSDFLPRRTRKGNQSYVKYLHTAVSTRHSFLTQVKGNLQLSTRGTKDGPTEGLATAATL